MIYWIIFLFLFLISILNESVIPLYLKYVFLFISIITLVFLTGFRGDIEPDYSSYYEIFENTKKYALNGNTNIEFGFLYINYLIINLGFEFQFIIFVFAFLSIVPKIIFFYNYSPNFLFSILIYYSSIFFLFDFIAIRQAITISIFMWSLLFVYQKNFFAYLITILVGSFIHSSILLLIPCYFIFNYKYKTSLTYLVLIVCALINILQIKIGLLYFILDKFILPDGTASKFSIYGMDSNFAFISVKQIFLSFVFVYINSKEGKDSKIINILTNVFLTGVLFATIFNDIPQLAYRIKWYFLWSESILILFVLKYFYFKKFTFKVIAYSLLFLFYANTLAVLLNEISSRGDYIYPYRIFIK